MEMDYLQGRGFTSVTKGERDERGIWTVNVRMGETISYPNGTVRGEGIEATRESTSFDTAHQMALKECLQQLQDLVYSRGFDSLIEALDYSRQMEATSDEATKADEASPSE